MDRPRDDATIKDEYVASIDDAFSVLKDETRLKILFELTKVANEEGAGGGLTFSELRNRVGVEDSGRFNYHLNKLSDGFITKSDDKYVARYPGLAVISSMYAGTYRDSDHAEPSTSETDFKCTKCSRPLEIHYGEDELFSGIWMYCEEHGVMDMYHVPPGAHSNRSLEELMNVGYTRMLTNIDLARRGICLECWGQTSIEYPVEQKCDENIGEFIRVNIGCYRCWNYLHRVPLRTIILTHPIVLAGFKERGYELLEAAYEMTKIGNLSICDTELNDTEPVSATVHIEHDDETLVMTVDEDCEVVEYQRRQK